jgi:hypothetical protein
VGVLLGAFNTRGTSDDETDDDSEHPNPDLRFKTVQHVDMGFLNPAIAEIWALVESYLSSLCRKCGNHSFKCIPEARSINRKRTALPGLPINYYNPTWFENTSPLFKDNTRVSVPLPTLVGCYALVYSSLGLTILRRSLIVAMPWTS